MAYINGKEILFTAKVTSEGGGINPVGTKTITANGTYDITHFAKVAVDVDTEIKLQEKTATANGVVTPDSGYDGLSKVTVSVETGGETSPAYDGSLTVTDSDGTETEGTAFDGSITILDI